MTSRWPDFRINDLTLSKRVSANLKIKYEANPDIFEGNVLDEIGLSKCSNIHTR